MFYPKLRHARSNSIINISSISHPKNISSNQNRSRTSSYHSHHQLCHSYSNDSLDTEFLQNTKQTINKLFHQTNFNQILDQIQHSLQPIIKQLRQQIQNKNCLSKQDRFICMKSCAKFITESLSNEQWDTNDNLTEFYQLQQVLNHFLSKQQTNVLDEQLEKDMLHLNISKKLPNAQPPRVSFAPSDALTRQKNYHQSVSRVFKKLNTDLQKINHETPFKAHLSKYHKHNH